MACDLFTSFNHHFVFSLKLIFLKILLVQLPALWLNTHILWGKKWLMSSKKLFEQTGSACNYVNWCSFVRFWWITIRSDTMVNTIFDGIWFWAVIETGDCSAHNGPISLALRLFLKRSKIFLIVQQEQLFI